MYQVKTFERISITTSRNVTSSDAVKFAKQSRPDTEILYQYNMYIIGLSNISNVHLFTKLWEIYCICKVEVEY